MEHAVYPLVILAFAAAAWWFWFRGRQRFLAVSGERDALRREKDEIEVEERRMFGFLHGLGETLQEDSSAQTMHRYVVDGVAEVIGADAGILYLLDTETDKLVPVSQSEKIAPVVPLPTEILAIGDEEIVERRYRNYVRLAAFPREGNLLAETLASERAVYLPVLADHEDFAANENPFQKDAAYLGVPLVYAHKRVGVLAMVKFGSDFSSNDREVFDSVAEQSSFALGSAIVHSEAAEKKRFERELTQASAIQKVLLPRRSPALSDYDVAAEYRAARILSGDYYDYLKVDEDRYGIAIGDVCGKGVAASLIMAMCRSNLRGRAAENLSPSGVLHEVNRLIFPDIRGDMFVSLLYLILERGSNEVTLARAGHEPPIHFHAASGEIELVEPPGLAAGIDKGPVFKRSVKDHRLQMESGDLLLLYTDGLIEAENRDGDEFGVKRLSEAVKRHHELCAEDIVIRIVKEISAFSGGRAQSDDITLIAVKKR